MSSFSIFVRLYMTAFLLEMLEKWKYPGFTLLFLGLTAGFIFTHISRIKFLIFLTAATAYFLIFRFPDVANHVNLLIYLNLVLISGLVYAWITRPNQSLEETYQGIKPILRASLIGVYFWAGFHKLNTDFLNPEVSCSSDMLYRLTEMLQSDLFGIPAALIVASLILGVVWKGMKRSQAVKNYPVLSSKLSQMILLTVFVCGGIIFCRYFLTSNNFVISDTVLQVNIFVVLIWELLGSLLLFIPNFQAPILLFSWVMHAFIAMIGFVDFSSLAGCLLLTFIPDQYFKIWQDDATLAFGRFKVNRVHLYFLICASTGIFSLLFYIAFIDFEVEAVNGALFNLAAIIFIWPVLSTLFTPKERPPWKGVPIFNRRTPKFMMGFLICLLCFGLMSYLGLRTAGNFSMFSNLRTEGHRSNHLILASNPWKVWRYQEDVIRFLSIEEDILEIYAKNIDPEASLLPVVEFKKMIYEWTQAGYTVPLSFEYQGKTYTTPDITTDPVWRTDKRTWEMILMDFRVIQPDDAGPNLCRW